jgi:MscS family membrane protein
MGMIRAIALTTFLTLILPGFQANAQDAPPTNATTQVAPAATEEPEEEFNLSTPRSSFTGFMKAVEDNDFKRATEFLDLRNLPRAYRNVRQERLAEMLAIVIERELWIDLDDLSPKPEGKTGDGLPAYRDELGRVREDDKESILLMQRIPDGHGGHLWKISNATVGDIADLYSRFGYGPITEAIAKSSPDVTFLGIELFKWIVMLLVGLAAYPIAMLLGLFLARVISSVESPLYPRVKSFFMGPVAVLLTLGPMHYTIVNLGLGLTGQMIARTWTLTTVVVVWLLLHAAGLLRDYYANRLKQRHRDGAVVLLQPATQSIRMLIVVIAFVVWLDNAGFNITTIVAGLGVGGIAMALALQKPLEDLFGALTLYTQQPVRIGDFCRIGAQTGTVEEIGLRTTRVRTLANTVISIPNHKIAVEPIDNFSARQKFLFNPTIRLRVDSSQEQIDEVLKGVRGMLESHDKVLQDTPPRIRFQKIGADALELGVFAYADVREYADYLEVAENLNIRILGIVERAGSTLALPGQSLIVETGGRSESEA